jgi:hypothetical protein
MSNEYPNTGGLWKTKEKKYDKSPDMWGELKLDPDFLRQLIDESNGLVVIKLGAWKKTAASGPWLALKVDSWKPDGQQSPKHEDEDKDPWD